MQNFPFLALLDPGRGAVSRVVVSGRVLISCIVSSVSGLPLLRFLARSRSVVLKESRFRPRLSDFFRDGQNFSVSLNSGLHVEDVIGFVNCHACLIFLETPLWLSGGRECPKSCWPCHWRIWWGCLWSIYLELVQLIMLVGFCMTQSFRWVRKWVLIASSGNCGVPHYVCEKVLQDCWWWAYFPKWLQTLIWILAGSWSKLFVLVWDAVVRLTVAIRSS